MVKHISDRVAVMCLGHEPAPSALLLHGRAASVGYFFRKRQTSKSITTPEAPVRA